MLRKLLKFLSLLFVLVFTVSCNSAPASPTAEPTVEPSPTPVKSTDTPIPPTVTPAPTEIPTVRPINTADYEGWWTYTESNYGFSIMLPPDWVVETTASSDALLNGHLLMLHPEILPGGSAESLQIRLTYRKAGEDVLLWPTGVGAGQFIEQGTLDVAEQPARRILLVCPTGQINAIWYKGSTHDEPNIKSGDMEFAFIFSLTGNYCAENHSLGGKLQYIGEMIVASLRMP